MVRRFERDDLGYIAWLAAHLDGYVLNTHIHPTSDYVILHRARCRTVNRPLAADRSWTYAYGKTCSDAREDLEAWALAEAGGPAQPCGKCLANPGRWAAAESGHMPVARSIAVNARGASMLGAIRPRATQAAGVPAATRPRRVRAEIPPRDLADVRPWAPTLPDVTP